MLEIIIFFAGVAVGAIYEKQILKWKAKAQAAAKAASNEFNKN